MFCTQCGKKLPADSRFCPECGTRLNPEPVEPAIVTSQQEETEASLGVEPGDSTKVLPDDSHSHGRQCPECGLFNPGSAQRCDCGFDFVSGVVEKSYLSNDAPPASSSAPWSSMRPPTGVHGWLFLLCVHLAILTPGATVAAVSDRPPIEAVPALLLAVFSAHSGIALWRVRPGAVRAAKAYFITVGGISIFGALLLSLPGPAEPENGIRAQALMQGLSGVVYALLGFSYLSMAKRVKGTYGLAKANSTERAAGGGDSSDQSVELNAAQIPAIVEDLARRLETSREEFVFAMLSSLKSEGRDMPHIPKLLQPGTEVDSALRAFQLTVVVGFCWKHIDRPPCEAFDEALTQQMNNRNLDVISRFRETYLDCAGEVSRLTRQAAADVYRIWGSPEPSRKILIGLEAATHVLAILSQAHAAAALGDTTTERDLRRLVSRE